MPVSSANGERHDGAAFTDDANTDFMPLSELLRVGGGGAGPWSVEEESWSSESVD